MSTHGLWIFLEAVGKCITNCCDPGSYACGCKQELARVHLPMHGVPGVLHLSAKCLLAVMPCKSHRHVALIVPLSTQPMQAYLHMCRYIHMYIVLFYIHMSTCMHWCIHTYKILQPTSGLLQFMPAKAWLPAWCPESLGSKLTLPTKLCDPACAMSVHLQVHSNQAAIVDWVAVIERKLGYQNPENILPTIHPEYGDFN